MKRSTERVLTTHTGSLPRGAVLAAQLGAHDRGEADDDADFEASVRDSVLRAVERQVDAGLDVVNDGEMGKSSFQRYRYQRLTGFDLVDPVEAGVSAPGVPAAVTLPREQRDFPEFYERWKAQWYPATATPTPQPVSTPVLCCTGPIGWRDFSEVERDLANLRAAVDQADVEEGFMTAISPGTYLPPNLHYASAAEYLEAMADAMAREYAAIVDAGFVLQIDAPDLTTMYRYEITHEEFHRQLEARIDAINHAVRGLPPERVRVHVCWGADEAPHVLDIPLHEIVHSLLRLTPQGLLTPGANGRHAHEWSVWEAVPLPDGKLLHPGVIDSTTNIVEHPEAVAERIVRYAGVVGRENVIAGVDCGFGTTADLQQVDERVVWAKLQALSEGAALASAHLW
jgi:5-methyltetrahydropteroyltriglutamate--homocysteine methyltransferase